MDDLCWCAELPGSGSLCGACADRLRARLAEVEAERNEARAERDRYRGVLTRIANYGCGCYGGDDHACTCRDRYPDDARAWCLSCLAAQALADATDRGE